MRRDQLEHAIRAACEELSLFHQTHGFYVHGVSIDMDEVSSGRTPGSAG